MNESVSWIPFNVCSLVDHIDCLPDHQKPLSLIRKVCCILSYLLTMCLLPQLGDIVAVKLWDFSLCESSLSGLFFLFTLQPSLVLTSVTLQALGSSAGFQETWAIVGAWISHFITKQHAPGLRPVCGFTAVKKSLLLCPSSHLMQCFLMLFFVTLKCNVWCPHSFYAGLCRPAGLCLPLGFGLVVLVTILSYLWCHKTSRSKINKGKFKIAVA